MYQTEDAAKNLQINQAMMPVLRRVAVWWGKWIRVSCSEAMVSPWEDRRAMGPIWLPAGWEGPMEWGQLLIRPRIRAPFTVLLEEGQAAWCTDSWVEWNGDQTGNMTKKCRSGNPYKAPKRTKTWVFMSGNKTRWKMRMLPCLWAS